MQKIVLYRQHKADGTTIISPNKPSGRYTTLLRLVADEGKLLTNDNINTYICVDVESDVGWYEIDVPYEEEE